MKPAARLCIVMLLLVIAPALAVAQCPQRYLDKVFQRVNVRYDIIYGGNRQNLDSTRTWLAFDLYEPKDDTVSLRPLIVLLHGGGFTNWPPLTRKSPDIVELANDLAKRGYVVASMEYRLFSGEANFQKMTETAMASAIDLQDALCFLSNAVGAGNPYRIDTSRFIIGGVSAGGAVALNFGVFVDDTTQLTSGYREILNRVSAFDGRDPGEIFANKFCGIKPKGAISISSGLFDTTFIQYKPLDVLLIHGEADQAIPFGAGNVFFDPGLPAIYGSGFIASRISQTGMHVELDAYPGLWHVPIIWNFANDLANALIQTFTTGSIFNRPILDSTERHMAAFCYRVIGSPATDCALTGVMQTRSGLLNVFPNPGAGIFHVQIPAEIRYKRSHTQVFDITGRMVYDRNSITNSEMVIDLDGNSPGMYWMRLAVEDTNGLKYYSEKLILH